MKETSYSLLGSLIRDSRLKVSLSQKGLAELLGYSGPQFISNWERGVSYPPTQRVSTVLEALKISKEEYIDVYLKQKEIVLKEQLNNTLGVVND